MCRPGFQLILCKKKHNYSQIWENIARKVNQELYHKENSELHHFWGAKMDPRWYRKQLSGGAISIFHFACGCCKNDIFEKRWYRISLSKAKTVVQTIYIYICIYAVKLLTGPSLGFLNVTNWAKLNVTNWAKVISH